MCVHASFSCLFFKNENPVSFAQAKLFLFPPCSKPLPRNRRRPREVLLLLGDGLDDVIGIISVAKLLESGREGDSLIGAHVSQAAFVPETLSGMELLEQLRAKSGHMVFVVDEYGVVQGLMTPRDLLEAITGELKPGAHIDAWATPHANGSWLLDGLMPINEMKARLDIEDDLPHEDKGRYNTVAGLLLAEMGRLPDVGDAIECVGWSFGVQELDGRRIDLVLARPLLEESAPTN